jgi:type VI protein secretion system component Hcp
MLPRLLLALGLLAALGAPPDTAAAAFLRIQEAPGESTEADHPKWILISGFQQPFQTIDPVPGRGTLSSLHLTKQSDLATPVLAAAVASPTPFQRAELEVTLSGAGRETVFYRVDLSGVRVLSHATHAGQDGATTETMTLGFERATWTYSVIAPTTGKPISAHQATWDFLRNTGGTSNTRTGFTVRSITLASGKLGAEWTPQPGRPYVLRQSASPEGPYQPVARIEPSTTAEPRWVELPTGHPFAFFLIEEE